MRYNAHVFCKGKQPRIESGEAHNLIEAAEQAFKKYPKAAAGFMQDRDCRRHGLLVFRPGGTFEFHVGDLPAPFNAVTAPAHDSIANVSIPWIVLHKESAGSMVITRNDHGG